MTRILRLNGHLGDSVSALVDGALSPEEEERAWSHTMSCPGCRRLVEREGWLKARIGGMAASSAALPEPRSGLLGALYDVDAWAAVDEIEREGRTRRVGLTAVGVGSVGAAVISLVALTGAPAGSGARLPLGPEPARISSQVGVATVVNHPAGVGASTGPVVAIERRGAR